MSRKSSPFSRFGWALLVLAGVAMPVARGQPPPPDAGAPREPLLPFGLLANEGRTPGGNGRTAPVRLFRMPTAFLTDPLGLDDEDPPPEDPLSPTASGGADDGRVQVAIGTDNPFFDFRGPNAPGGVGYYKVHTQVQLLEAQRTALTVGFQAVTPAGRESDGLANGPTFFSPNVAWFQELGGGNALHGFVGTDVLVNGRFADRPERGLQYGVAVQSPVPLSDRFLGRGVHLFVEALGRLRGEDVLDRPTRRWELLPGLHWQMTERWWLAGGVLVPLGDARPGNLWQITCSWQFGPK
jgi:hypothetical protein